MSTKPKPLSKIEMDAKRGVNIDFSEKQDATPFLKEQLVAARKKLEEKIRLNDERGIKKAQEIIKNIEQTLARNSK